MRSIYIKVTYKESLSTLIFSRSLLCFSMSLTFCLVVCNFAHTSLFSSCVMYNSTLSLLSFSKAPYKFWTNCPFPLWSICLWFPYQKVWTWCWSFVCCICCMLKHIGNFPMFIQFCFESLYRSWCMKSRSLSP